MIIIQVIYLTIIVISVRCSQIKYNAENSDYYFNTIPSQFDEPIKSNVRPKGGYILDIEDYPYHVSIEAWGVKRFVTTCSGTIISSEWILTAASCLHDQILGYIYMGESDRKFTSTGVTKKFNANNIYIHPNYSKTYLQDNNIAVINIKQPIVFSATIKPIELLSLKDDEEYHFTGNKRLITTGWGYVDDRTLKYPNRILVVRVAAANTEKCQQFIDSPIISISDNPINATNLICGTVHDSGSPCHKDVGGPAIGRVWDRRVQVGVVSFGIAPEDPPNRNECKRGYVKIFTRITPYLSWIAHCTQNVTENRRCESFLNI